MVALPPKWQHDAAWFPHRVNCADGVLQLVKTDTTMLRAAPFLDGRACFWTGDAKAVLLGSAMDLGPESPPLYLFHQAFCGSTLLASLIERNCRALALKEPQALVDLADANMTAGDIGDVGPNIVRLLYRRFDADEPVVIKPSNWVNSLAPMLMTWDDQARSVLLTIEQPAFLRAVFRGGRDRMAFTARAAAHFALGFANGQEMLRAAIGVSADPLGQMAHLAALAHRLQDALFDAVRGVAGQRCIALNFADLQADTDAALAQAATGLGLSWRDTAPVSALVAHAKAPDQAFDASAEARHNAEIAAHHGGVLDAAHEWAATINPVWISNAG